MQTGRRGFLKSLGAVLAGLTVAVRTRAEADKKLAHTYTRKYRETSSPPKPLTYKDFSGLACSGRFSTGVYCGPFAVSGRYDMLTGYPLDDNEQDLL